MPGVVSGMTFGIVADLMQFDADSFIKDQKMAIVRAIKNAARVWLITVMSRIPRETGFLHSGFMNLAAFLGSRINDQGQVKRGRDLHGQEEKLASLQRQYKKAKEDALARGYIQESYSGKKRKFKAAHPKPQTKKQRKERPQKYKKKQQENKKAGFSQNEAERANQLKEEGLNIHTQANNDEKKNSKVYKREQNQQYYQEQRDRRAAAKAVKRLKKLQAQIRNQKIKVASAAARAKPLRLKQSPGYDRWETVTVEKTSYQEQEVEELNPAYPTNAAQLIRMKKAGTLPPKTIKVKKRVAIITKKQVRRQITGERKLVNIYRDHYYPINRQKGPLKTPLSGIRYGTPPQDILKMMSGQPASPLISEETTKINKGGFEVSGNELLRSSFSVNRSLNMASQRVDARNSQLAMSFNYGVNIRYLKIMDLFRPMRKDGKVFTGAPWKSYAYANRAFMKTLNEEFQKAIQPFISYVVVAKGILKTPGFKRGL